MFDPLTLATQLLKSDPELGHKIRVATFCSPEESLFGLAEVVKFLALAAAEPKRACTPSRRVDLAWHEFILFTRTYFEFCQEHFGRYIHHDPARAGVSCFAQYLDTLRCYRLTFGEPEPAWWDLGGVGTADCGACEAH